jgi:hypothetical protein
MLFQITNHVPEHIHTGLTVYQSVVLLALELDAIPIHYLGKATATGRYNPKPR